MSYLNVLSSFFNQSLIKTVIIKKISRILCIGKMQFTLINFVPKYVIKVGESHFIILLNTNGSIVGNHQNHLITFIQYQKEVKAVLVIAFHVVCHVMVRNQIQKFLVGTENKNFMILEGLWRYEHGLMMI